MPDLGTKITKFSWPEVSPLIIVLQHLCCNPISFLLCQTTSHVSSFTSLSSPTAFRSIRGPSGSSFQCAFCFQPRPPPCSRRWCPGSLAAFGLPPSAVLGPCPVSAPSTAGFHRLFCKVRFLKLCWPLFLSLLLFSFLFFLLLWV